ncbi:MAG: P-loop NTPase fold protein [Halobacteriota archaeon]|nr:P-loop NTPase fold protein [Halobacteriota archaeon]
MAQLIDEESGGKSIALTGSWGCGKSTVVEILKKEMEQSDTEVFVFDAWAHEGDPLRRTFLEQLIDFFTENGRIKKEKWEKEKLKLSRKLIYQTVTSTPVLTPVGQIFALATFFVPIGLVFLSLLGSTNVTRWIPLIGFILVWLPLYAVILLWIREKCKNKEDTNKEDTNKEDTNKEDTNKEDTNKEDNNILSLLANRTKTINNSETCTTPDPTSIEFQDFFKELLDDALSKESRKLLIVIDNLDRVDAKDALGIWATMRTFFDFNSNPSSVDWLSRLWLLVPFDPTALDRLWQLDSNISENKTGNDGNISKSFSDKSFQITFNVAPPVLTSWKDFLLSQLKGAFPDHDSGDFHKVYRLYRLRGLANKKLPTPRDLKLFVNQIGSIHRQWHDEIKLLIQALYVILQRNDFDFEEELIKGDFLNSNELQLINPDYRQQLAALHFNVEEEEAYQILMGPHIEKALNNGDVDSIKELCGLPGFVQVCEHVVDEEYMDWSIKEERTICIAAHTLSELEQINDLSWKHIWDLLCIGVENVESFTALDEKAGKGLIQLFKHKQNSEFAQKIVGLVVKSIPKPKAEEKKTDHDLIDNWLSGVFVVLTELLSNNYSDIINEHFYVDCPASTYLELISNLCEKPEWNEIQPYFKTTSESTEIVAELVKVSNEGSFDNTHSNAVKVMLGTRNDWEWGDLITALNKRLQASNNLEPPEIQANINALLYLKQEGVSQADGDLASLASQGHLLHHFHKVFGSNNQMTTAICLIPLLKTIPGGNVQQHVGNSQAGFNNFKSILGAPAQHSGTVKKFAELVIQFWSIEDLLKLPEENPSTSDFVSATMEVIAKRDDAHELLHPSLILSQHQPLSQELSEGTFKGLIEQSIQNSSLVDSLVDHGFDVSFSKIYLIVFRANKEKNYQKFIEFLINGMKKVDKEIWVSELQNAGQLIELVIDLVGSGIQLNLSISLQDALFDHAGSLIGGSLDFQFSKDRWKYLCDALDTDSKNTFLRNLLDIIVSSDKTTEKVLEVYGEELKNCDFLTGIADSLVRNGFKQFIERMSDIELKWLSEVLSVCPEILNKCPQESKTDFENRVTGAWNDGLNKEAQAIFVDIAKQLKIDLPTKKEVESEGDKLEDEPKEET